MERPDYEALAREILEHDRRYHVDNNPVVSDLEYDQLMVRLREIEEGHPEWVVDWSPTRRVGQFVAAVEHDPIGVVETLREDFGRDERRDNHAAILLAAGAEKL